jgi:hypothetical protein
MAGEQLHTRKGYMVAGEVEAEPGADSDRVARLLQGVVVVASQGLLPHQEGHQE